MLSLILIPLSILCFVLASSLSSSQKRESLVPVTPQKSRTPRRDKRAIQQFVAGFDAKAFLDYERVRTAHLNEHNVD